jgi:hypothetical protein
LEDAMAKTYYWRDRLILGVLAAALGTGAGVAYADDGNHDGASGQSPGADTDYGQHGEDQEEHHAQPKPGHQDGYSDLDRHEHGPFARGEAGRAYQDITAAHRGWHRTKDAADFPEEHAKLHADKSAAHDRWHAKQYGDRKDHDHGKQYADHKDHGDHDKRYTDERDWRAKHKHEHKERHAERKDNHRERHGREMARIDHDRHDDHRGDHGGHH